MKLIYLTAKSYPGRTADHGFIKQMAKSFNKALGSNFLFTVANNKEEDLNNINIFNFNLKIKRGRSIWLATYLPWFYKKQKESVVFFSNDVYLLMILIGWRKVAGFNYKICSDWHQMWGDYRDKLIAKNSDYLISTSEKLKRNIITRSGIEGDKILVARGGVDLKKFEELKSKKEIREELGLEENKKYVGYVGGFRTMGMEKGIDTLIKSISGLGVNLVLVGGKEKEIEEYKELADREGVLNKIIFKGWQEEKELYKWERAVDVLVIPYPNKEHFREWGMPMKVYEYMASGTPIVYSDLDLMGEVLKGEAIAFEPDSTKDLANKINKVLTEKIEGRLEKVKDYTWEKRVEKIVKFIKFVK